MSLSGFQIKNGWSWKKLRDGSANTVSMSSGRGSRCPNERAFPDLSKWWDPGHGPRPQSQKLELCPYPHFLRIRTVPTAYILIWSLVGGGTKAEGPAVGTRMKNKNIIGDMSSFSHILLLSQII